MTDTGPARLPGIPSLRNQDPALIAWAQKVQEHLEVRAGARGNDAERVVTQRELADINKTITYLNAPKRLVAPGDTLIDLGGGLTATVAINKFIDAIRQTQLFKDLKKDLNDPSRFDGLAEQVRNALLVDLAGEAAKNGAAIQQKQTIIQNSVQSLAMTVQELTASLDNVQSGIRETSFASASRDSAQAGKVTQIVSSLGNYYQDGAPGRAVLEETMTTFADRITGLRAQYTLKVQAGKAIAGFGIASTETTDGNAESAFIISANKFAVVDPATYTGGLTNSPDTSHIPFGIDSSGIYLNSNVYVKGTLKVDTGGKTLIQGLRGSVDGSTSGTSWSDNVARQVVWTMLGNSGSPTTNNHLVPGDKVTIYGTGFSQTKQWLDTGWADPGVVINGSMLVDGSLTASKIDTRGLTIKDSYGNVVFSAGVGLSYTMVTGLGSLATQNSVAYSALTGTKPPTNADNTASNTAAGIAGQGTLATQNYATIGSTIKLPDGSVMGTGDFVNRLGQINSSNISTFMAAAAIGNAYIGNAAVDTLNIAGNAVTVPLSFWNDGPVSIGTSDVNVAYVYVNRIGSFAQGIFSYTHTNSGGSYFGNSHDVVVSVVRSADGATVYYGAFSAAGAWGTPFSCGWQDQYTGGTYYIVKIRVSSGSALAWHNSMTFLDAKK